MHRSGRYASLREGLVGAWCPSVSGSFGYSLPDLSGYGNHGALTNMDPATDWVASGGKMALDFDGSNDAVIVQNSAAVNIAGNGLTLSAWVNPVVDTTYKQILAKATGGNSSQRQYGLYITGANSPYGGAYHLGFETRTSATVENAYGTLNENKWYHCVGTYNGAVMTWYLQGVNIGEQSQSGNIASTSSALYIGQFSSGGFSVFNGQIDDARIYSRALTPSEIQLLYSGGRGVGLIPERRRWFYFPSAFTGTAAVTTGAATCSGSATFTKPVYTGTSTVTTAAATCSAIGTFTKPVYSATSSVTIAAATCSATGTFTKPVYSGTSTLTVGHATASGAATFVAPVYTASAAVAVGATVVNVAGSVVSPTFTGTAAVSVPAATITATGTFSQFSQITASKPRRLNIVTHRASLNIATHAHVST